MTPSVPAVEVADYADALRVGCPHAKQDSGNAVDFVRMRAQEGAGMAVPAFGEQVQVEIAHLRTEGIRVARNVFPALGIMPDQAVMLGQVAAVAAPFEQVSLRQAGHRQAAFRNLHLHGARNEGAHHGRFPFLMAPQYGERVVVPCFADPP